MRFQVSRVMDTIEQRLTTDVTLAQAVVDLSEVARFVELDGGRPINLLRVGMVVDALARYLVDAGAMLYPIAGRELLSESALTSKERMVLSRWADDGLIEVTPVVSDRAAEIADYTGVPLIVVRDLNEYSARFGWLTDSPERVLHLIPRAGGAKLSPGEDGTPVRGGGKPSIAVGKVPFKKAEKPEPKADLVPATVVSESSPEEIAAAVAAEPPAEIKVEPGVVNFTARGVQRSGRTRVVRQRFLRFASSGIGGSLTAREWRCLEPDCPAFGQYRRIGQPVPRMRNGVPACPRHGTSLKDIGPRRPAYAVSLVIDDLPRRRFVVSDVRSVIVGRDPKDPDDVTVGPWLHEAAVDWIGEEHLRLEVRGSSLVVTDTSDNGTLVWQRKDQDDAGTTTRLYRQSHTLGEWDSLELYTGVELVHGDRRLATTVGSEPLSVLVDAPTVALRLPDFKS